MHSEIALYSFAFLQGAVGSLHCAGMCGPFACIIQKSSPGPYGQLIYNGSRTAAYATMGALVGFSGQLFNQTFFSSLAAVLGAILIGSFALLFFKPRWAAPLMGMAGRWVNRRSRLGAVIFGLVAAFLPCGLLFSAYALAMSSGKPLTGAITMLVFSLATWPMLLLMAYGSHLIPARFRSWQKPLGLFFLLGGMGSVVYRTFLLPDPYCH